MRLDHYLLYHMNERWTMKQTQHSAVMEQIRDSCGISKVYKSSYKSFVRKLHYSQKS